MNARTMWVGISLALIVLIVLIAGGLYVYNANRSEPSSGAVSNVDDAAIRATVEGFGRELKNVSLLAPDAAAQIQTQYSSYVAPELLETWKANPTSAMGRQVSSPWPDSINVASVTRVTDTVYTVEGNVIEVVQGEGNTEPAAVYPVTIRAEKRGNAWLIAALERGAYSELPKRITVDGFWECLPHKDRTGPQTMECAFGIAIDRSDGHYAIDTSLMSTYPVDFPTGTKVRVQGVMTPANQLSSIQKYDIDGIIRATSIQKI